MKRVLQLTAGGAALISLAQPALAQSADCLEPRDFADATTYAMPLLIEGLQSSCDGVLPADGYVMGRGDEFAAGFEPLRDAAWPGARRIIVSFIERETGADRKDAQKAAPGTGGVIQSLMRMEGDELRPFVDAMATQMIASEIKSDTCNNAEAILPLLAPLPPENYGELVAQLLGLVGDEASEDDKMKLCGRTRG